MKRKRQRNEYYKCDISGIDMYIFVIYISVYIFFLVSETYYCIKFIIITSRA